MKNPRINQFNSFLPTEKGDGFFDGPSAPVRPGTPSRSLVRQTDPSIEKIPPMSKRANPAGYNSVNSEGGNGFGPLDSSTVGTGR